MGGGGRAEKGTRLNIAVLKGGKGGGEGGGKGGGEGGREREEERGEREGGGEGEIVGEEVMGGRIRMDRKKRVCKEDIEIQKGNME